MKKNKDIADKLKQLQDLYSSIPPTKCMETKCADWCCSRLPGAVNEKGQFISLPLIYSIEFLSIKDYVYKNLSIKQVKEFNDYNNKKPLCCFKDPKTPGCLVYPVRPFTCRVFGRRVPPIFFGVEYPSEAAENVFCSNCKILDPEKEGKFQDKYPLMWATLADLSASVSVFSAEQLDAIHEVSDVFDIYLMGWKEFALLSSATPDTLKKNFAEFWDIHGKLL